MQRHNEISKGSWSWESQGRKGEHGGLMCQKVLMEQTALNWIGYSLAG